MRRGILIFTAAFLLLLALNIIPEMRGGWGWRWPYGLPDSVLRLLPLAVALIVYLGGVLWTRRAERLRVVWAILGAVVLSIAAMAVRGDPLYLAFTRTVSPVYSGASTVAVHHMDDVDTALKNWPSIMADLAESSNIHMALSPPGKALVHRWLADGFEAVDPLARPISDALRPMQCSALPVMAYTRGEMAATLFGLLMPLWSALTILPLYAVGVQMADRDSAARMVQWWPLVPSTLFFAISWNSVYPLLVTSAFALLVTALKRNRMSFAFASGLLMSVATFMNFSVVPALMLMGWVALGNGYLVDRGARRDLRWLRKPVTVGLWYGLGLLVTWALFWIVSRHTPLTILQTAFDQHLSIERDYVIWLVLHVYDLILFAGWPLVLLALVLAWRVFRKHNSLDLTALAVIAALLTMLIVTLSDTARGETARVWLFFVPFLLLAVMRFGRDSSGWDMPLMVGQAATVLVILAVIPQMATFLDDPPDAPREDIGTLDGFEVITGLATFDGGDYGGAFALDGYRVVPDPAAQAMTFELFWRGVQPTERPYEFEMIARAENPTDGEIVSEPHRWYAQNGAYLPTCWREGDSIRDIVVLRLPPVSEPVIWDVTIRAVDDRLDAQMAITLSDGTRSDALALDPVRYP